MLITRIDKELRIQYTRHNETILKVIVGVVHKFALDSVDFTQSPAQAATAGV